MSNFKFIRENDIFKWESDFMLLQFSNPSVQGFSSFLPIKSEGNIMYYYYTVDIFKKFIDYDDDDNEINKIELVSQINTHDFPCILSLKNILEYQLNDDSRLNGQRIEYRNRTFNFQKSIATEGFGCDDFYEITKIVDNNNQNEKYIVYCGGSFEINSGLNNVGLRTSYVDREDILALLSCIKEFIQYSIEINNEELMNRKECFAVKDNKIYEYEYDVEYKCVNKNKIDSIYTTNDKLDITIVENNQEIDFVETHFVKIEKDNIYLKDGNILDIKDVVYITDDMSDERLRYNQDRIAKDFIDILSNDEKEEFKTQPIDDLLNKYKRVIINRTWMCREEHNFDINYGQGDRVTLITPIVKEVIEIIKRTLN